MNFRTYLLIAVALATIGCYGEQEHDNYVSTSRPPPQLPSTTETPSVPEAEPTATSAPIDAARRITLVDAIRALDRGEAVLVDVRGADAYQVAHAVGAIHIPEAEILNRIADIPIGKMIITYCT